MSGKRKNKKKNKKEESPKEEEKEMSQKKGDEEEEEEEEEDSCEIEDNKNKKCSLKEHKEIDAINYCQECKIYMCNKCEKFHFELFKAHHLYSIDKNLDEIFTGICLEKKHNQYKLQYFCKNHNQLCCAACLCKIKGNGNGKHKDCNVCFIKNIKEEKKK